MEKTQKPILYARPNFYFCNYRVFFMERIRDFVLFELAKKFRTFTFYNKELKQRLLVSEINGKKLKNHGA